MARLAENVVEDFAKEYAELPFGERNNLVKEFCRNCQVSRATAYRILKNCGAVNERDGREGLKPKPLNNDELISIASMKERTRRLTGMVTMPTGIALEIAVENNLIKNDISAGYLNTLLRDSYMDSRTLKKAKCGGKIPSMPLERRSEYPMQWYFMDASVCLQYRFGKKEKMQFEPADRYYGKDLKNYANKKRALFRFAAVDHFTKMVYVHYYYDSGERADNWVDFLLRCFMRKTYHDQFPMAGVPDNIYTDKGSGLAAAQTGNLLEALGVEFHTHMARNPRGKGPAEVIQRVWQEFFECRLALRPAENLAELNSLKDKYLAIFNATRPMQNAYNKTRLELWRKGMFLVPEGHGRLLPENRMDAIRALAHKKPEKRKVGEMGIIDYNGQEYRVSEASLKKEKVEVYPSPYHLDDILIVQWREKKYEAKNITRDENGFSSDAVCLGEWRRAKDGIADKNIKILLEKDLSNINPFAGDISKIQSVSDISARQTRSEIEIPDDEIYINETLAREWLREQVGPARYKVYIDDVDRLLARKLTRGELAEARDEIIAIAKAKADEMNKKI